MAFRGTVVETELSEEVKKVFVERFTFYHADGVQILAVSTLRFVAPSAQVLSKEFVEIVLTRCSTQYQERMEL